MFPFLIDLTLYNRVYVIHLTTTDSNSFLLWLSNILFYICTTTSLSIHRRTSRLPPYPGYCKYCCSKHWGKCVFLNCGFLRVYAHSEFSGSYFIFLGSKITVDDDCHHKIKRHLLLGRKVMTNLDTY